MAERAGAKWPAAQATVNFIGGHDPLATGLLAGKATTGINSVTEKIRLYQVWTKSKSNILPYGDPVRCMAYKEHRKILC